MRRPSGWISGAIASLALAAAGAVAAWAATPVTDRWTADPEEQFLLDVNIRQLRLGDGVRAYGTPEGTCVVFGDFLATLDVPMKIDLQAKRASGWAFREEHRIDIDQAAGRVTFGDGQEKIAAGTIRETPEGWCVETAALGRWFKLGVKPVTAGSILLLESEAKLPVELAREREQRAAQIRPAALPFENLPRVKLPYRLWRAPALDFIVNAGVSYQASTGMKVDRRASVVAAGEVARLSYDAMLATDDRGMPQHARVRAFRSDPDGELLGPLRATHFGLGDVQGLSSRLVPGSSGRGFELTNRPLFNPVAFDRTRFEGDLPPGWDAELYRNRELLAFSRSYGSGRYAFEDVPLIYGDNQFEIILYGPQGQQRSRLESINVGQSQVPAGKTWYWAGVSQPGRDLLGDFVRRDDGGGQPPPAREDASFVRPDLQAAVQLEHGIDKRTSVAVLANLLLADGERLTFVEGSVRRSIGPALVEGAIARDSKGGSAARAQAAARLGSVNLSADALMADGFTLAGKREDRYRDARLAIDAPLKIGRQRLAAHGDVRFIERGTRDRTLNAAGRLSSGFNGFNLSALVNWQRRLGEDSTIGDRLDVGLIGTGRIKDVRLRGEAIWDVKPDPQFRTAELSAYWSASERADWEGTIAYDAASKRARARVSHIRRFDALAAAASIEGGTDGSFAAGINLNFSLDAGLGGFKLTNRRLASTGSVEARVYRDLNDNGQRDAAEPWEAGAAITTGQRVTDDVTDKQGRVRVGGLQPYQTLAVGIDTTTLADPNWAPKKALQLVVPRPGVTARLEIGLVGAGAIEGALVRDDGRGFEGLDVELLNGSGAVVATGRSDYDGFFLFEQIAYGRYSLRLSGESAKAVGVDPALDKSVEIGPDRSVARLGTLRIAKAERIALGAPVPATSR